MTTRYSANVTKLRAGGSGDNYIADGYIKTVEKVWIDTYALDGLTGTGIIATLDTLVIAQIAPDKRITDVIVYFPTALTPTTATILVGTVGDTDKFIKDVVPVAPAAAAGGQATIMVARMNNEDGALYATTGSTLTDIVLSLGVIANTAPTVGTITTIVKYS